MRDITRRGFIAGSAIAAGLVGLAGCSAGTGSAADPLAAVSYTHLTLPTIQRV